MAVAILDILQDPCLVQHWYDAAAFLFASDCRNHDLPCDRAYLIALLYDCLDRHPTLGCDCVDEDSADNLVWSIVYPLKGVGYL